MRAYLLARARGIDVLDLRCPRCKRQHVNYAPFGNEGPEEHECQRCFHKWSVKYGALSNPLAGLGPVVRGGKLAL